MTIYFSKFFKLFIVLFIAFGFFFFINQALACDDDSDCTEEGQWCVSSGDGVGEGVCEDRETDDGDEDSDETGDNDGGGGSNGSSGDYGLGQVPSELPRDDIATIIVRIIRYVIGLVGIILLVMLIYGGVMYMTSAGNEEQAGKAKQVLTYAIVGIVIVAFSFLITQFIVSALTGSTGNGS